MTPTDALRDILGWLDPHGNNRDCDAARAALAAAEKDENELVKALKQIEQCEFSGDCRHIARAILAKHAKE